MTEIADDIEPGTFTRGFERESKRTLQLFDGIAKGLSRNIGRLKTKVDTLDPSQYSSRDSFRSDSNRTFGEILEARRDLKKLVDLTENVVPVMEAGTIRLDEVSEDNRMRRNQLEKIQVLKSDLDDVEDKLNSLSPEETAIFPETEIMNMERSDQSALPTVKVRVESEKVHKERKKNNAGSSHGDSPPLLPQTQKTGGRQRDLNHQRPSRAVESDLAIRRFLRRRRIWVGAVIVIFLFLLLILTIIFLAVKLSRANKSNDGTSGNP